MTQPAPSFAPPIMAAGLTLLLWGAASTWVISAAGVLMVGVASVLWLQGSTTASAAAADATVARKRQMRAPAPSRSGFRIAVDSRGLHPYALLTAVATLALVITGALVTSTGTPAAPALDRAHLIVAILAGALALGLAVWIRGAGGVLLAALVVESVLGGRSPAIGALHAFLAHVIFAATVVIALLSSPGWKRDPEYAEDMSGVSLRLLGIITAALVVVQVALGAAVRHKVMGSGLHITFALVVALMIVTLGVLVMNHCAQHRTLRPFAVAMMVIAGVQVFLGFGAFIVRMMADEKTPAVVVPAVAHVTAGALTLAATVALALELHRHLRPAAAQKGAVVS